jgi:hypothetical protein
MNGIIFFEKDQTLGVGIGQKINLKIKIRIFISKKCLIRFRINQPANIAALLFHLFTFKKRHFISFALAL